MAFGKPVITTKHVEIPRIIDEITVNENDVDGLAQAIRQVYESAALRQRLGEKNRQIAEDKFSTRNAERTARIFENVVRRFHGSPYPQPRATSPASTQSETIEVVPR